MAAVGVLSGVVVTFARTPLHWPGHKVIFWMAPILASRMATRTRAGATVGASAASLTAFVLGGRLAGGAAMMPLVMVAGAVMDAAVQATERRNLPVWRQVMFLGLAGMAGNLICFVKRLFDPMGAYFSTGNFSDMLTMAASHAIFGFLAGLIGAGAGLMLLAFRRSHVSERGQ
jgi:hypothetical protein